MSATGGGPVAGAVSVAALLDRARELMVQAWDRDHHPEYLLVHPTLYHAVMHAKRREAARGRPVRLLGMVLVASDETPIEEPDLR